VSLRLRGKTVEGFGTALDAGNNVAASAWEALGSSRSLGRLAAQPDRVVLEIRLVGLEAGAT